MKKPSAELRGMMHPDEEKAQAAISDVRSFIHKHGLNSEQIESAYISALGTDEAVEDGVGNSELVKMLKTHFDSGVPVNRIGELVAEVRDGEAAIDGFKSWIQESEFSENEQKVLLSVVAGKRMGTVQFLDRKTKDDLLEIAIPDFATEQTIVMWAENLKRAIVEAKKRAGGKVEVWFEETT